MRTPTYKLAIVPVLMMTLIACSAEQDGNAIAQEPGNSTAGVVTPTEPVQTAEPAKSAEPTREAAGPSVTAGEIGHYEDIVISDWMDEDTVVVSKENDKLGKMSLEELADSYPKSLYFYHLDTKEFELIKEQENVFLGDAVLSSDNRFLLYSEFSLGDPVYYVMDLGSKKTFSITGDDIAGAMSARWADDDTVIGPAYSGGAFTASTSGKIGAVEGLSGEGLVVVRQIKDKIYYTSNSGESLQTFDLNTKEKAALKIDHVGSVIPSPDGDRLLVLQYKDSAQALLLTDTDGGNQKIIVEGTELGGVSWSPDQRMIAYSTSADGNGTASAALYVYDLESGKSIKVADATGNLTSSWSPSGKQLAYTEWSGDQSSSSVVQLKD
ncbi:hypothetical protein [Paenibacillus borealis]|uniref:TolB protein n=1 Tax=Paenibacillus borealis TaxID=160799 RepID=A0A089MIQ2_PAEBO|nr:hypothetical protein [Paenibacillus borealis]AIQ56409.1 hypothetical protein PBOR_05280 [Paenibacillus borealis]